MCIICALSGCATLMNTKIIVGVNSRNDFSKLEPSFTHVDAMNSCCEYLKNYEKNNLPQSSAELEKMLTKINTISDLEIFFSGFSQSDFQEMLEAHELYYKNDGVYDETYLKYEIYYRLSILRMRILLHMKEYEKYEAVFRNTYYLNVMTPYESIFQYDTKIQSSEETLDIVMNSYKTIFEVAESEMEMAWIVSDLMSIYNYQGIDTEQLKKTVSEMKKYVDPGEQATQSGEMWTGFTTYEINPNEVLIYKYE